MSCKFINPHSPNTELELSKQLQKYYNLESYDETDEDISKFLEEKVSFFFTDNFKEQFGDWVSNKYPEDDRIDAYGSPKLFNDGENLFVYDLNNEKLFINNIRFEGLYAFPSLAGKINQLKEDATSMIVKYIFDKYKNIEEDITDFSNISFNLSDEIKAFFDYQTEQLPQNADAYDVFKDFTSDFEAEVKEFLKNVGLTYIESKDNDDSSTQEELEDNGAIVGKGSVEKNSKDNASGNVKLMMALLPDENSNSEFFAGRRFLPFSKVWNEVQSELSDLPKLLDINGQPVNPITVINDKLDKMAVNKPHIKSLIETLNSSNFNLQVQFFQAFGNLGKTKQDTLEIDNKTKRYKTLDAAESSSKKSQVLTQAGLDFKNKFTTYDPKTNTYSFDLKTYADFRKIYFELYGTNDDSEIVTKGNKQIKLSLYESLQAINFKIKQKFEKSQSISEEELNKRDRLHLQSLVLFQQINAQLGFNIEPNTMEYFMADNGKYNESSVDTVLNRLGDFTIGFDQIDKYILPTPTATPEIQSKIAIDRLFNNGKYLNPFKGEGNSQTGQRIISDIAFAIGNFNEDMSENMVISGDKQVWVYSLMTHLLDKIHILNESPKEVEKLLKQPFNRHSVYLNEISNGKKIKLHRTNSMMEKDNAVGSVDNQNTSKYDAIVRDVFESLRGKNLSSKSLYSTPVPADKGTALKLETDYFLNTQVRIDNEQIIVNQETLDIFKGYFNDELSTAIQAKKFIETHTDRKTGNVDTTNLIQYKHTDANGNTFDLINAKGESIFSKGQNKELSKNRNNINIMKSFAEENGYRFIYAGNAFKNYMTPSLSPENLIDNPDIFGLFYEEDFSPIDIDVISSVKNDTLTLDQNNYLDTHITNLLNDLIKYNETELTKVGVFQENGYRGKFDSELWDLYFEEGTPHNITRSQIVADYTVNNIIAQVEYSKIFNGSINNHKNEVDYFKRVPKTYIDGKSLMLGVTENDHISHIAILQDMETSSPYIDQMGDVGKKFYGNNRINQADAQAYITPERWKFLLERLGQFGTQQQKVYNKILEMEKGNNVEFTSKELKILSTKPLKGVYFSNENNNPLYLKYSQTVLLRSLVKGSPLEKLLNQMQSQKIDEAIMASGVKVGAQFALDNVSEAILTNKDKFTLKSIPIDNRFWKLQQDLPNKGIKDTLLGSQIQKNIFDNFKFEDSDGKDIIYEFNGKSYTGKEVYNNIHSIIGEKSRRGLEKFKKKFDIQKDFTINNWGDFAKSIAEQLRSENIDENVIQAVEKELTPYVIPQAREKILSTIMSMINKSTVKLKTNGASLIQMSNFGLDQNLADETGIIWIKDKQQLAEPRKLTIDGKVTVLPGQIFISGNLLGQYIPNWRDYSLDELFGEDRQGGMFPKEILQMVGYRIPNQAMSSNDALEVVGILPDTYIDTVVAYTGITTKTGSDFDVDKMFMMLPSMKQTNDGVIYDNYDESKTIEEQSEDALNNRLFEMYHSVLTHPDNYDNLITPIDEPHIKDFITKELFPTKTKQLDYNAFSPLYQIDMKYEFIAGGFGIGQVANQLVDSVMNQVSQKYINQYIGWGNYETYKDENGKIKKRTVFDKKSDKGFFDETGEYRISASLTALLNGFVDIAKDPYITRGNWNTQTTNTGAFLIRVGVHPSKVCAFLAQPSLVEMVNKTAEKEGITSEEKDSSLVTLQLKEFYLKELQKSLKFTDANFNNLKNDINDKKQNNLINGVLSNNKITSRSINELKSNILLQSNEKTPQYYLDQYLALVEYEDLKNTVKEFTKSVGAAKYGENGIGKNTSAFITQANKTADVLVKLDSEGNEIEGTIKNFKKQFENFQIDNGLTSLGNYYMNSEVFFKQLIDANPKIFLTASTTFVNIMNKMASEIHKNKNYLDDESLGKVFEQAFYTMMMKGSKKTPLLYSTKDDMSLLFHKSQNGIMTLTDNIVYSRETYRKAGYPNFLLETLIIKEDGDYSFIGIGSLKNKPKDFKKKLTDAWRELDKDNPLLSDDLVKLAYQQSGFKYNSNQIYQYIPHEIFLRNKINTFVSNVANYINSPMFNPEIVEDNIYRHNWQDSRIVPIIENKNINKLYPLQAGFSLKPDSNRHSGQNKYMDILTYPKFVSYNDNLYQLDSYVETKNGTSPIYFITHKLGYKSKFGQFHEYDILGKNIKSFHTSNNITIEQQNEINKMKELLKNYNTLSYNDVKPDNNFSNITQLFGNKPDIETPVVEIVESNNNIEQTDLLNDDEFKNPNLDCI